MFKHGESVMNSSAADWGGRDKSRSTGSDQPQQAVAEVMAVQVTPSSAVPGAAKVVDAQVTANSAMPKTADVAAVAVTTASAMPKTADVAAVAVNPVPGHQQPSNASNGQSAGVQPQAGKKEETTGDNKDSDPTLGGFIVPMSEDEADADSNREAGTKKSERITVYEVFIDGNSKKRGIHVDNGAKKFFEILNDFLDSSAAEVLPTLRDLPLKEAKATLEYMRDMKGALQDNVDNMRDMVEYVVERLPQLLSLLQDQTQSFVSEFEECEKALKEREKKERRERDAKKAKADKDRLEAEQIASEREKRDNGGCTAEKPVEHPNLEEVVKAILLPENKDLETVLLARKSSGLINWLRNQGPPDNADKVTLEKYNRLRIKELDVMTLLEKLVEGKKRMTEEEKKKQEEMNRKMDEFLKELPESPDMNVHGEETPSSMSSSAQQQVPSASSSAQQQVPSASETSKDDGEEKEDEDEDEDEDNDLGESDEEDKEDMEEVAQVNPTQVQGDNDRKKSAAAARKGANDRFIFKGTPPCGSIRIATDVGSKTPNREFVGKVLSFLSLIQTAIMEGQTNVRGFGKNIVECAHVLCWMAGIRGVEKNPNFYATINQHTILMMLDYRENVRDEPRVLFRFLGCLTQDTAKIKFSLGCTKKTCHSRRAVLPHTEAKEEDFKDIGSYERNRYVWVFIEELLNFSFDKKLDYFMAYIDRIKHKRGPEAGANGTKPEKRRLEAGAEETKTENRGQEETKPKKTRKSGSSKRQEGTWMEHNQGNGWSNVLGGHGNPLHLFSGAATMQHNLQGLGAFGPPPQGFPGYFPQHPQLFQGGMYPNPNQQGLYYPPQAPYAPLAGVQPNMAMQPMPNYGYGQGFPAGMQQAQGWAVAVPSTQQNTAPVHTEGVHVVEVGQQPPTTNP